MRSLKSLALIGCFGLALLVGSTSRATCQSFTWTSFQTSNWNSAANWTPGIPTSGATTDLFFNGILDTAYTSNNDLGVPFVLRSMTFNNQTGGVLTINNSAPNFLQFAGGAGSGIAMNGPGSVTIQSTTVDLAGAISVTGNASSGILTISSQITGAGGSILVNRPSTNFLGVTALTSATNNTFGGGVTIQNGILSISAGGNVGTGTVTFTSTGFGLAATGELRASAVATLNNPVTITGGSTLTQNAGSQIVFGQAVSGLGGLSSGTYLSAGTVAVEGASGYGGRSEFTRSVLTLRGTTGALTGTTQLDFFRNSSLVLDSNAAVTGTGNVSGNEATQNRIRDDAVVSFHRTNFTMTANTAASTSEVFGTLNGDGWNIMNMTPQAATGASIIFNNLNRVSRGTFEWEALNFGVASPGTANSTNVQIGLINGNIPAAFLVGGGGAAGTTNISIVPFMTSATAAATTGSTLVTYGPNGLRQLNTTTEFATSNQIIPYGPGATDNVRLQGPQVLASQPVTANSMTFAVTANDGVYGFGGLTGQLNVTSGVIHNTVSTSYLGTANVSFGGAEAIITGNGQMIATAALINNSGLTYSGGFRFSLMSPNNVIGGPITLNFGTIQINSQVQLGGATSLNFNGGFLQVCNLATGSADTISTPINIGAAGGIITAIPVGGNATGTSQIVNLTGTLTGTGPIMFNSSGLTTAASGGTVILAGNAAGFSGQVHVASGVLRFDSDARLGTGSVIVLGGTAGQPATLYATASTSTNKNIYLNNLGFINTDAGTTYTVNGFITGTVAATSELRKIGAGELVLTREATYSGATVVGNTGTTFLNVGGTLRLRDQGAIVNTSSFTVNAGSTLVADNTGANNLNNRLNNVTTNMAGGTLSLLGSTSAASQEIVGPMSLAANTGSVVEVVPGAGQTAALFFSGPTTGGFVRAAGSTVTFRSANMGGVAAGSGQINFIHNTVVPTGPTLTNGILANSFGEDTGAGAIGLVTVDTIAAGGGLPQYYRTRLLTAGEYTLNAFPNAGVVTTNHRQTAAAAPTGSPTVNSLFLDTGGSLAITAGNTVTLTSGTLMMAGGTSTTGGSLSTPAATDLSVYVGAGGVASLGSNINLATAARTFAKTGPGALDLTAAITGPVAPGTFAIQRGSMRLNGGSIPIASIVNVDAGATFDINGTGGVVEIAAINGLGSVQLGSTAGTVLRVSGTGTSVFGGTIAGTGAVEKSGTGILEFAHTANYTGPITLTAGTVRWGDLNGNTPLMASVTGGTITAADGTTITEVNVMDFARPIDINVGAAVATVTLNNGGGFGSTSRISGPINVAANKTLAIGASTSGFFRFSSPISGAGNVNYNSVVGAIIDGNSSYTGTTTIASGTLIGIGNDNAFGNGGTITNTVVTNFYAEGGNRTIANPINLNADVTFGTAASTYQGFDLNFSGNATTTAAATRTITTVASGRMTLTNLAGVGANLVKAGGGTLALAGANISYSGTTAVNAGTLLVNGTMTAGGGAVTVALGAALGGSGTINRSVTVNALGAINPGTSPGNLTIGGDLTFSANSIYFWELGSNTITGPGSNWDRISMTAGNLTVTAGSVLIPAFIGSATLPNLSDAFWAGTRRWDNIIDLTGSATNLSGAVAFTIDNSVWLSQGSFSTIQAVSGSGIALLWTPSVIPEPATMALLFGSLGAAGGSWYWRRQKQKLARRSDPEYLQKV